MLKVASLCHIIFVVAIVQTTVRLYVPLFRPIGYVENNNGTMDIASTMISCTDIFNQASIVVEASSYHIQGEIFEIILNVSDQEGCDFDFCAEWKLIIPELRAEITLDATPSLSHPHIFPRLPLRVPTSTQRRLASVTLDINNIGVKNLRILLSVSIDVESWMLGIPLRAGIILSIFKQECPPLGALLTLSRLPLIEPESAMALQSLLCVSSASVAASTTRLVHARSTTTVLEPLKVSSTPCVVLPPLGDCPMGAARSVMNVFLENRHPTRSLEVVEVALRLDRTSALASPTLMPAKQHDRSSTSSHPSPSPPPPLRTETDLSRAFQADWVIDGGPQCKPNCACGGALHPRPASCALPLVLGPGDTRALVLCVDPTRFAAMAAMAAMGAMGTMGTTGCGSDLNGVALGGDGVLPPCHLRALLAPQPTAPNTYTSSVAAAGASANVAASANERVDDKFQLDSPSTLTLSLQSPLTIAYSFLDRASGVPSSAWDESFDGEEIKIESSTQSNERPEHENIKSRETLPEPETDPPPLRPHFAAKRALRHTAYPLIWRLPLLGSGAAACEASGELLVELSILKNTAAMMMSTTATVGNILLLSVRITNLGNRVRCGISLEALDTLTSHPFATSSPANATNSQSTVSSMSVSATATGASIGAGVAGAESEVRRVAVSSGQQVALLAVDARTRLGDLEPNESFHVVSMNSLKSFHLLFAVAIQSTVAVLRFIPLIAGLLAIGPLFFRDSEGCFATSGLPLRVLVVSPSSNLP